MSRTTSSLAASISALGDTWNVGLVFEPSKRVSQRLLLGGMSDRHIESTVMSQSNRTMAVGPPEVKLHPWQRRIHAAIMPEPTHGSAAIRAPMPKSGCSREHAIGHFSDVGLPSAMVASRRQHHLAGVGAGRALSLEGALGADPGQLTGTADADEAALDRAGRVDADQVVEGHRA